MKNLKIAAASVALLLSIVTVSAQPQQDKQQRPGGKHPQREMKSPEKMAEMMTDKMDQELDLSDSQEKKIYAINLDNAKEAAQKREEMKGRKASADKPTERPSQEEMEARKEKMKAQKAATEAKIMNILDDEQKIKYAKMTARMEQHRGGEGRPQQGKRPQPQKAE